MKKNSLISVIIMIICVVLLVLSYIYFISFNYIEVPVAVKMLNAKDEISSSDIQMKKIPKDMSKNVITKKEDLVNHYVNYNTIVPEGGLFYKDDVVELKDIPDSILNNLDKCNALDYLVVSEDKFKTGDSIDLYYEVNDSSNTFSGTFIEGVEVLSVKNIIENGTNKYLLIFELPTAYKEDNKEVIDLHMLYMKSKYAGGEITAKLYENGYKRDASLTSDYIKDYINNKVKHIKTDSIDSKCLVNDN